MDPAVSVLVFSAPVVKVAKLPRLKLKLPDGKYAVIVPTVVPIDPPDIVLTIPVVAVTVFTTKLLPVPVV